MVDEAGLWLDGRTPAQYNALFIINLAELESQERNFCRVSELI